MIVRPSKWKPWLVFLDACEHRTPEAARALAARILRVADKVEKKKAKKRGKP